MSFSDLLVHQFFYPFFFFTVLSAIIIIKFPLLSTALDASYRFWYVIFSYFKIFFFLFLEREGAEQGALHRAQSHDPEIMTRAKIKSQMLNCWSHPGTRDIEYFQYYSQLKIFCNLHWFLFYLGIRTFCLICLSAHFLLIFWSWFLA